MKRIVIILSLLLVVFVASSAVAADKVVVIPLSSSKSVGLQHYRLAEPMGTNTAGCETVTFTTPNTNVEAVAASNLSLKLTTDYEYWWTMIQYSKDGGAWSYISAQVAVTGSTANIYSNTSEKTFITLVPDSEYKFRVNTIAVTASDIADGQCEIFITFNQAPVSPIVTTAAASSASRESKETGGVGTNWQ